MPRKPRTPAQREQRNLRSQIRRREKAEGRQARAPNPWEAPDHAERTAMFKAYREAHGVHALAELCSELYLKGRS